MVNDSELQITTLKEYTKDIIEETYAPILHELKKRLSIALNKEQENQERLDRYEKELELYRKCHDCHRVNVEKRDAETQVTAQGPAQSIKAVNIQSPPSYAINPIQTTPPKPTESISDEKPSTTSAAQIEDVETITLDDSD